LLEGGFGGGSFCNASDAVLEESHDEFAHPTCPVSFGLGYSELRGYVDATAIIPGSTGWLEGSTRKAQAASQ
jgi:hypothetical protein